jgi:glycine betaine/proline transport system substrate-binding protein
MQVTARSDFADDYPEVAEWLSNFTMTLEQLQSLEAVMFSDDEIDDFGPVVSDWITENQDYIDGLTA